MWGGLPWAAAGPLAGCKIWHLPCSVGDLDSSAPQTPSLANAWRGRLAALKNIPPVLRILWNAGPTLTILNISFRILAALIPVSMLWVSKLIIDNVVAVVARHSPVSSQVWRLLALEFGLACAGAIFGRVIDYYDSLLADQFTKELSIRVMEHASRLDLASYEDPAFYDKLERARVQTTDRLGMLVAIGRMGQQIVTLLTLATGVFLFSPWLLLLLVAGVVPAFIGESHFAFLGYSLAHRLTPVRRELDYLRVVAASKESAKEVKIFGLAPFLMERYRGLTDRLFHQNRALARRRFQIGSLLAAIGTAGYYSAYAVVIYRTLAGRLSVGELTFLAGAIAGSSSNIQMLFSTFSSIADQALFLTDLWEFFAVQPRIQSPPHALPAPRPIRKGFEFRHVSFHYPDSPRLVLWDLNLRLEPGDRIALIGENGEGKTTLVKLLARLYDPTGGVILLDDIDLREYSVEDLSKEIGIIFQDFVRYEMAARENIAVGQIEQLDNRLRVDEAARKSLASGVIEKLPRGYEQILGRRFEGGVDLSGGEWQKFALARAYMREAQVLILDEPTASLDARSEYEVFCRFAELTEGRMAVLISHRFSTVRVADRILVLEGGCIREVGTHAQLIALGGRYADMFNLQASAYR
jgi:ATP-binding cassette subfamily B protein